MKINKTVSGTLTREEVDQAVKEFVGRQMGSKVVSVRPRVAGKEDPSDWRAEYPLTYVLDGYEFEVEFDPDSLRSDRG